MSSGPHPGRGADPDAGSQPHRVVREQANLPDVPQEEEGNVERVRIAVGQVSYMRGILLACLLLLGTLLFLFALLLAARGAPVHGVVVEGLRGLPPAVADPAFPRTVELHTGSQLMGATTFEVLLNGDGTFPRLWEDIRSARQSITVQQYYFKNGAVADSLASNLMERARAGVRVLMLLDAFGARTLRPSYLRQLTDAGVEIAFLRPFSWYRLEKSTHRSHVRSVVVDGEVGYTGGFGFGDLWLGNGKIADEWRETNVRVTGATVMQLQAGFMAGWAEATGELLTGAPYFPDHPPGDQPLPAGFFHFAPALGSAAAERFLALSIATARSTLYIANAYFVPDVQFRDMLADAASRGVDVRILTAGRKTDIRSTRYAARAHYAQLLSSGVRIYEYQPTMMHAKTFVVDGLWVSVGSLNFDNRSISFNDEANLVAIDSALGQTMHELFLEDLRASREILLDEFHKRGAWERIKEFAANLYAVIL